MWPLGFAYYYHNFRISHNLISWDKINRLSKYIRFCSGSIFLIQKILLCRRGFSRDTGWNRGKSPSYKDIKPNFVSSGGLKLGPAGKQSVPIDLWLYPLSCQFRNHLTRWFCIAWVNPIFTYKYTQSVVLIVKMKWIKV